MSFSQYNVHIIILCSITFPIPIPPKKTVHYEGTLAETGEVFDTTREDNTVFTFEIGKGSVIKAWDVALRTMKVKLLHMSIAELPKHI